METLDKLSKDHKKEQDELFKRQRILSEKRLELNDEGDRIKNSEEIRKLWDEEDEMFKRQKTEFSELLRSL